MKVRSHAALIGKKHDSTLLFRQGANLGEIPLDPLFDQRRILLERPAQRLLATQPHLRQQSTHRDRTELDAVLAPNQRADHRSRPERKGKLQLKRIFRCHGIVDPSQLRPRQPLRTPARLARAKRIPSASTIGCQPHKYPGRVKTKRTRHRRWRLSSLHCFHRLKADRFQLCVAQLAAVDLHESNATSSLAKINKIVANL